MNGGGGSTGPDTIVWQPAAEGEPEGFFTVNYYTKVPLTVVETALITALRAGNPHVVLPGAEKIATVQHLYEILRLVGQFNEFNGSLSDHSDKSRA